MEESHEFWFWAGLLCGIVVLAAGLLIAGMLTEVDCSVAEQAAVAQGFEVLMHNRGSHSVCEVATSEGIVVYYDDKLWFSED